MWERKTKRNSFSPTPMLPLKLFDHLNCFSATILAIVPNAARFLARATARMEILCKCVCSLHFLAQIVANEQMERTCSRSVFCFAMALQHTHTFRQWYVNLVCKTYSNNKSQYINNINCNATIRAVSAYFFVRCEAHTHTSSEHMDDVDNGTLNLVCLANVNESLLPNCTICWRSKHG